MTTESTPPQLPFFEPDKPDKLAKRENEAAFLNAEWEQIKTFWNGRADHDRLDDGKRGDLLGLALSGGGIRAGSFATGVAQALAETPADGTGKDGSILANTHILSTVSGGGFFGGALTRVLQHDITADCGTNFPFRRSPAGPSFVNFRQRASYLEPGAGIDKFTGIAVVMRTTFVALLVYFMVLLAAMWTLQPLWAWTYTWNNETTHELHRVSYGLLLGLGALVALAIAAIFNSLLSVKKRSNDGFAKRRRDLTAMSRVLVFASIFLVFGMAGQFAESGYGENNWSLFTRGGVTVLTSLVGIAGTFISQALTQFGGKSDRRWVPTLVIWASGIVLAAMMIFAATKAVVTIQGLVSGACTISPMQKKISWEAYAAVAAILWAITLILGLFVNVNYTGLHRYYRDRILEAFFQTEEERKSKAIVATEILDVRECCQPGSAGPYHLINTNVVLVNSDNPTFKGRGGDAFVLSPAFCGSAATGWLRVASEKKDDHSPMPMSLASAVAISGAALNPSSGADGEGPTRSGMLSFILSLLNIRLGYWVRNPWRIAKGDGWHRPPNFLQPGLGYGLLSLGHREKSHWLELTDGGHFDNIGIYELLRRRVKTIIAVDGTADPEFDLSSFANAYERARNDFDITIDISNYAANFNDLLPGTARPDSPIKKRYELAERGFAIGVISYPGDAELGYIFYVKSVLTENLPSNLYSYRGAHPNFPNEPTVDQFFNEREFDAYCELGYELTKSMVEYARAYKELAKALGVKSPRRPKPWKPVAEPQYVPTETMMQKELSGIGRAIKGISGTL